MTNDFPPRPGGIQSYLENLVDRLPADQVVVYASSWDGAEEYDAAHEYTVIRHRGRLMLPTPGVAARARDLVARHDISTVWFGAAAPLAVLGPTLRRAGARRIVASTHGHEVGWSMVPVARGILRRIGDDADVITYVSDYTRRRFSAAFGPRARLEYLPPGVDTDRFAPDPRARERIRERHALGDRPTIVCLSRLVPRKGQDVLIEAMSSIVQAVPDAVLLIVGGGPYGKRLHEMAAASPARASIMFTGTVVAEEIPAYHNAADVFAMPARTRGGGLDVEGFGIVYLEASACGVPVVAGRSGGAPETVVDGSTGYVVDGRSAPDVGDAVVDILTDPVRRAQMGTAGREWAVGNFQWGGAASRLAGLL